MCCVGMGKMGRIDDRGWGGGGSEAVSQNEVGRLSRVGVSARVRNTSCSVQQNMLCIVLSYITIQ